MEKDYWLQQKNFHWQEPDLNCMNFVLNSGRRDLFPAYPNPYPTMVSPNGSLPGFAAAGLPQLKVGQANEPHGWFYGLPRHRQALTPKPNAAAPKELSVSPFGYGGGALPNPIPGSVQKNFLVFDQSGDQTSLFFNSAVGSQIHNPSYGHSKPFLTSGLYNEEPTTNREMIHKAGPICTELEETEETGDTSEMHEDTEELNALLYSDDEYDSDDEETSTGHSPRDITAYQTHEVEDDAEEVASCACPAKRKRQSDEENYTSSLVDTASSGEVNETMECKDDAESSCGEGSKTQEEMGSLFPANKRLRREKIRETVSILQSIIPGGKGKDAILVIDEAIQYLRSLKLKAKSLNVCSK